MPEGVTPIGVHDGRVRAVVENITPIVDGGRFAVKRALGDTVTVEADCFADGHDVVACALLWRLQTATEWQVVPMAPLGNDRWRASFPAAQLGRYRYTVCAWVDHLLSWQHDLARRIDADDVRLAVQGGAKIVGQAAQRTRDEHDRHQLQQWAQELAQAAARDLTSPADVETLKALGADAVRGALAARYPDLRLAFTYPYELPLIVERERARFSTWYELFPRSTAKEPGRHGTFADCAERLPYIARMGFDVLYLPPIHPIGRIQRKGKNNTLAPGPDDTGSPWAIGAEEGGHTEIHPQLGTLADFRHLVERARGLGIEIALDIAFQCAPDHPYVREHPAWFRRRADGSVQYAENPPKKYQDIYPFDFESEDWPRLWHELARVFEYWIGNGVSIFRVDNPHTKAFSFWEWAIERIHRRHPEVIFLSEAFTRPKVMHRLAKLGFSQSYTYFAWRNTKYELTEYFTELAQGPGVDYFRPNVWPNTPDILTEVLQYGTRGTFMARVALAATLAANYGIYGPAYELMEQKPRDPGSEEYLDSEKYQLRHWDLERADSLAEFIGALNRARRENPALQSNESLRFLRIDNDQMIAYAKSTADLENVIVTVVNLDPHHVQSASLEMDLAAFGLDATQPYQMHDLITGARYIWNGARNYVSLDPQRVPVHILRLRHRLHREQNFDYFM
ncbi:MAG TPA: alpha-1,4-glucan--maltose-1-phosphate maltosyltransferase [Burkholderiaceae bacterium]|nr:alpha-1,4-glucan--maltose-1-phosphate maltosyltransferase [Burkholderiaceae bacterium]